MTSDATDPTPLEPAVTVTTVVYNSADSIERYAAQLAPSATSERVRVIVVDNASPDDSVTMVRDLIPQADVITSPCNLGFAAGCNLAWPQIRTRYWLLLNPDVEADATGIERLVGWMDQHPHVGVASPLLRSPDGVPLPIARAHDSLWRPVVETFRLHKLLPRALRSRWLLAGHSNTSETIRGWIPGAALIARTAAVTDTGSLDERLFMYGEDREWCWRMGRAAWAIGICREVEFVHGLGSSTTKTWGDAERVRREVVGHLAAARLMRGRRWTRVYSLLTGLALSAGSIDRRREREVRAELRLRGRFYLGALYGNDAASSP
jgi:GT2 family glycosyltransferase